MMFSNADVIDREKDLIDNRKEFEQQGVFNRMFNNFRNPRNPKYVFSFYVPEYIHLRSSSFCEDVEEKIKKPFTTSDLANVLYIDFLEYFKSSNNGADIYSRLKVRDIAPTDISPYNTEDVYKGVIFEEQRGFELIDTTIEHRDALRGELLLRDMLEIYPEHGFVLENILEIIYYDFINDYRRFLIKNPIGKIAQYANRL